MIEIKTWSTGRRGKGATMRDSAYYRDLARKCRQLAAIVSDEADRARLRRMSQDYEEKADRLEATGPPNPTCE